MQDFFWHFLMQRLSALDSCAGLFQFASTAKKMKNSPKLNEVLDDEALLKRYRREIEDLKRCLKEVSLSA